MTNFVQNQVIKICSVIITIGKYFGFQSSIQFGVAFASKKGHFLIIFFEFLIL
jgi:hypothetical protein